MIRPKPTEISLTAEDIEEASKRMAREKTAAMIAVSSAKGKHRPLQNITDPRVRPGPRRSPRVVDVSPRKAAAAGQQSLIYAQPISENDVQEQGRKEVARHSLLTGQLDASPASEGSTVRGSPLKRTSPEKVHGTQPIEAVEKGLRTTSHSSESNDTSSSDLCRRFSGNLNFLDGTVDLPRADFPPRTVRKQENIEETTNSNQGTLDHASSGGTQEARIASPARAWRSAWDAATRRAALPFRGQRGVERSTQSQIFGSPVHDAGMAPFLAGARNSFYSSNDLTASRRDTETASVRVHVGLVSHNETHLPSKRDWADELPHRSAATTSISSPNLVSTLLTTAPLIDSEVYNRDLLGPDESAEDFRDPLDSQVDPRKSPSAVSAILRKIPSPLTTLERNAYARLSRLGKGSPRTFTSRQPDTNSALSSPRWPFMEAGEPMALRSASKPRSPGPGGHGIRGHPPISSPDRPERNNNLSLAASPAHKNQATSPVPRKAVGETRSPAHRANLPTTPSAISGRSLSPIHHSNPWYPFENPISGAPFLTANSNSAAAQEGSAVPDPGPGSPEPQRRRRPHIFTPQSSRRHEAHPLLEQQPRIRTPAATPGRSIVQRRLRPGQRDQENPSEGEEARGFGHELAGERAAMDARERRGESMEETPPPVGRFERRLRGE